MPKLDMNGEDGLQMWIQESESRWDLGYNLFASGVVDWYSLARFRLQTARLRARWKAAASNGPINSPNPTGCARGASVPYLSVVPVRPSHTPDRHWQRYPSHQESSLCSVIALQTQQCRRCRFAAPLVMPA
jgi:hypothetical protein